MAGLVTTFRYQPPPPTPPPILLLPPLKHRRLEARDRSLMLASFSSCILCLMMGSGLWVWPKWHKLTAFVMVQMLFLVAAIDLHPIRLPRPYSETLFSEYETGWNKFVVLHNMSENVLTIMLSVKYTIGWVGIGFSKNGMMVGSSAMVGWVNERGRAKVKQFYLKGIKSSEVIPDKGELPLINVPAVALELQDILVAFQLKVEQSLYQQSIILAYGKERPIRNRLSVHDDMTTFKFNIVKEHGRKHSLPPHDLGFVLSVHWFLGTVAWGLALPCGALIARYLRHKDPLWRYLHTFLQSVGLILGLPAVAIGPHLRTMSKQYRPPKEDKFGNTKHDYTGVIAYVFIILQVLTLFVRPNAESKRRKFWSYCHRWFGRFAVGFGTASLLTSLFLNNWRYTILGTISVYILGINFLALPVLELWLVKRRSVETTHPLALQMSPTQCNV